MGDLRRLFLELPAGESGFFRVLADVCINRQAQRPEQGAHIRPDE